MPLEDLLLARCGQATMYERGIEKERRERRMWGDEKEGDRRERHRCPF